MMTETTRWYQNRRQFVGRVSGATAIMVASGLGFKFTPARKGERLASLSGTDALQRFGVSKYRIRFVDVSGGRRRVEADLLGARGDVVGRFKGVESKRRGTRPEDALIERELALPNESLAVRIDKETKTFHVSHNQKSLGEARPETASITPELKAFTEQRPELLRFLSEVHHEIGMSLRDLAPASLVITQNVVDAACVCLPKNTHCDDHCYDFDYDEFRSYACANAKAAVQACCKSKAFGQSCCNISDCDCGCFPDTDFFCVCHVAGDALSCSKITCS